METPTPQQRPGHNDLRKKLMVMIDPDVHTWLKAHSPIHGLSPTVNDIFLQHMRFGETVREMRQDLEDLKRHIFKLTSTRI